jgi:hypothetical protein
MERLLRACVFLGEAPLLAKLVFDTDAADEEEDVVDVDDVEILDVKIDFDDVDDVVVDEVLLLVVEVVIRDDDGVVKLGLVMKVLGMGIKKEVGIKVGMTGLVGRIAVGANVPGMDAGGVHWKPLGTSDGMSVSVNVTNIGTTTPVGAAVGTDGKSTVVKTFGPAFGTSGVN